MRVSKSRVILIGAAIYFAAIYLRIQANGFAHPAMESNIDEFYDTIRWYTLRDIGILTILYGAVVSVFLWFRRKR